MSACCEPVPRTGLLPWYGLRVRSKHEQTAFTVLRGKGYEPFLPSYKVKRRWTDRVKEIELPLFAGYVFCRLDAAHRLPILMSTGVIEIVGIGRTPSPIEEREIEAIRTVMKSGLAARPWPFLHQGDKVTVKYGPLRGIEGVVTSDLDVERLVVSVTLLQRSIALKIDPTWVTAS